MEKNPEITEVESVTRLGGWGEWGKEYSAIVKISGKNYRIWTTGDGVITDRTVIE